MQSEVFVLYIKRALEDSLVKISKTLSVLFLTGPRQNGKTTLLQHLAEEQRTYVTLDDPALFMQRYTPPIIIDEIQYAPEILKMHVDRTRRNGKFWLIESWFI